MDVVKLGRKEKMQDRFGVLGRTQRRRRRYRKLKCQRDGTRTIDGDTCCDLMVIHH